MHVYFIQWPHLHLSRSRRIGWLCEDEKTTEGFRTSWYSAVQLLRFNASQIWNPYDCHNWASPLDSISKSLRHLH